MPSENVVDPYHTDMQPLIPLLYMLLHYNILKSVDDIRGRSKISGKGFIYIKVWGFALLNVSNFT